MGKMPSLEPGLKIMMNTEEISLEDAGSAYLFHRDSAGYWHEHQKIVAFDRQKGDSFGGAVAIDGSFAIVGAMRKKELSPQSHSRSVKRKLASKR